MNTNNNTAYSLESDLHIHKHFDKNLNKMVVNISPGGFYITNDDEVISTVLGSCISVCFRDTVNGIAAMNHFMVPGGPDYMKNNQDELFRFGKYSMEHMLHELYALGATKNLLELKVFGGGAIISNAGDVGKLNIDFIKDYFKRNQLIISGEDLGGDLPRKVNFFTKTGKVYLKRVRALHKRVIANREAI